METIISLIAKNCEWHKTVNEEYMPICEERIAKLQFMLPRGSGIDCGCYIDIEKSGVDKVIINFSFHFMDENGYYDGWGDFKLIVRPKLWNSFDMKIVGKDKGHLKDYFYDLFDRELRTPINAVTL